MTRPMGEATVYQYDEGGNRIAVIDAKGQKVEYEYDAANRLIKTDYFTAENPTTPTKSVSFTYDELGNMTTYNDGVTSGSYTYDDLQRKTAEEVDYGPFNLSHAYTYFDNSLKRTFTGPDNVAISYDYDAGNRLGAINIPGEGQITYNTYQWNSPARITLPGGATREYTYNPLMRLKTIMAKDPGTMPFMYRNYTYSPAGNITIKEAEHGYYNYQYDNLYRLTAAANPETDDEAYTYDALGNRMTAAGITGAWNYNLNNELITYDTVSMVYDENGNMTRKSSGSQVRNYIYNVEDRLARVEDGNNGIIGEYYYDPFGRRLWKDVGGVRTCYLYADEGLVGEYDASGNEIKAYGYVPNSMWTTDPLFQKTNGTYYWYQNDHLGTPQKMIDSSGRTVWSAVYDSFGGVHIGVDDVKNNLRFPGQYYDQDPRSAIEQVLIVK